MTDDLNELRRLAEAATPGLWFVAPNGSAYYGSEPAIFSAEKGRRGQKICSAHWGFGTEGGQADYYFIAAANPAAILSLIKRVEEAEAQDRVGVMLAINEIRWAIGDNGRAMLADLPYVVRSALIEAEQRGYQRGLEEAAAFVETHACATIGGDRVMEPSKFARHDTHHACIAKAIRAMKGGGA